MPEFTFHIGINQRKFFDHTVTAEDLEDGKAKLIEVMAEGNGLHVFDVVIDGGEKIDMCEDLELPDERRMRLYQEQRLLMPLRNALKDIISSSDANCGDSLANAITAAKHIIENQQEISE